MSRTKVKPQIIISSYDDIENPYYGGGGAIAIHAVAKRLTHDFNVTVLTGTFPGARDTITRNRVKYVRIGSASVGAKMGQVAFTAQLPYYARRMKHDLWIESFTPPFSTSMLPLVTDKPVIGLVHMLAADDMRRKYGLPFHLVENTGLKWYRSFIVPSDTIYNRISALNTKAAIVRIPNGVSVPAPYKQPTQPKHFLFMGRIEVNQKGIDLMIEAYARAAAHTSLPLVIAGGGADSEVAALKKLIAKHKLTDRVKLVGRVSGRRKEILMKNSAALLCPSRFETFPLLALEAMAYKKCLVGFSIDGLTWIPDDCMMRVNGFSTASFAKKLVDISQNPARAMATGEQFSTLIADYDWDATAQKYKEFITDTLTRASAVSRIWQFGARS